EHGGDFSRSVAQSARDNPLALAVTGVGLAWLIFGGGRSGHEHHDHDVHEDDHRHAGHAPARPGAARTRTRVIGRPAARRPARNYTPPHQELPSWAQGVEPYYGVDEDHPPFREQTAPD